MSKAELVVIMKDGRKQKNVRGAVLADKTRPPFAINRDGYYLRWWGVDHPASKRILELAKVNGCCPARAWCFVKRLKVSKAAMPWHKCAFEEHYALWQCHESGNGHERVLDRGDVMARCVGAAFCKNAPCDHAKVHRWDPLAGYHAVHCRTLEAALAGWNEETKGPPPDVDVAVVCEMT